MFNKSLKQELALAKEQIATLETKLVIEKHRYKELTEVLASSARATPVVVDFKLLNAVSIERVVDSRGPFTLLCYAVWTNSGTVIREQAYVCSDAIHHDLVTQFRKYLQTR